MLQYFSLLKELYVTAGLYCLLFQINCGCHHPVFINPKYAALKLCSCEEENIIYHDLFLSILLIQHIVFTL